MSSPTPTTTPSNSLPAQLEQIGLHVVAGELDDFLARATKQRWSPRQRHYRSALLPPQRKVRGLLGGERERF